ncbi:gliding motility-associated C-terminal domain-containing protein [Winogradskyella maritima]|uniref:Gliding motility-associated C-terminal domain-containing protein n=1 Tax=Winogradskyella maritima TaxID=1517766 RepID=A0ABV8AK65_9FLAO|nr:gliding motility-associated C-terminal domain-containing protein [Winogradskyella maritima]
MYKTTRVLLVLIFFVASQLEAQMVIGTPNLGFSQACASPSFNTYNLSFSFSPESGVEASNQFFVELSDAEGSFDSPEVLFTSNAGAITTTPANINFSFPETVSGDGYKIRIKSTAPNATSTPSVVFPAYYRIQDEPFTINNFIETAIYCNGDSYLLTIDNPGGPENNSPLQYPSLTYNWYLETSDTTSEFISQGETLLVNTPGTYFVETNYGSCSSQSFSNRVTVSEATSSSEAGINSSKGNPYCSSEGATTLSTINAVSYQWYKDGELIEGATNQMYVTEESGNYSVSLDLGDCTTTAGIDLDGAGFESSIDVPETNMLEDGESFWATVTTDATNPEIKWYKNGTLVAENTTTYEVSETGSYTVEISQTMGCVASRTFQFSATEVFPDVNEIPNLISPNGDGINDTWVIPQAYVSGTNTEVKILSAQGKVVFETNDYLNNWPQNLSEIATVNPVYFYVITPQDGEEQKGTITVIK